MEGSACNTPAPPQVPLTSDAHPATCRGASIPCQVPILNPSIPLLAFIFRRLTCQQSISTWGQLSFWAEKFWVSLVSITVWVLLQLIFIVTKELGVSCMVWHLECKERQGWHSTAGGTGMDLTLSSSPRRTRTRSQ